MTRFERCVEKFTMSIILFNFSVCQFMVVTAIKSSFIQEPMLEFEGVHEISCMLLSRKTCKSPGPKYYNESIPRILKVIF